ncbi:MAG: ornithine carbamoyltransferase [Planctomycetota bacterium]|nr:ornithine carbamoyltransferase [Planctomycetota bacterium]
MTSVLPMKPTASATPRIPRNLLAIEDLDAAALQSLLALGISIKADPLAHRQALEGLSVALIFEKPSLRTRASLEVGLHRLGAQAVVFDQQDSPLGVRESIHDLGRNLERWFHAVAARVHRHEVLEALSESCDVPVLNTLSDLHHPCQCLADLMTMVEHGVDPGRARVGFVGDGNNVCRSLLQGVITLGGEIVVVSPPEYGPSETDVARAEEIAAGSGGRLTITDDPDALAGTDAVYTDAWISMGETDSDEKRAALERYRVDATLMSIAGPESLFMHCLPAHRGEEVVDEVIDGPRSVVYDQAENRLHAQNAWFIAALGGSSSLLQPVQAP